MTTRTIADTLAAIAEALEAHQHGTGALESLRNELVQELVAAGWAKSQIANVAGLSRQRIGQITEGMTK